NRNPKWLFFQEKCSLRAGRVSCFSSDRRKEEEARKALENALSQKKDVFENWNNEIAKRGQDREGGGGTGQGGWFGGGGWYGWFGGDKFWEEAMQVIIVIFGIGLVYLLLAKGEVIFNSSLFLLQKIRKTLHSIFFGQVPVRIPVSETVNSSYQTTTSAKERVIRKWGMD
ncbi:sulfate adenylyltransferase subunit, partial [Carex rostrata]